MKKVVVLLVVVLVAAGIIHYFKRTGARTNTAELVPADTILFFQLPDLGETRRRWKNTALYQIAHEPEVQAFLARPKSKLPQADSVRTNVERALNLDPQEAFVALTSVAETTPKFVAGFSFHGKKQEVDAWIADARKQVEAAWPDGKADIAKYGTGEIETFTNANTVVATAFKQPWCFVSDDLDLLKATLDRVDGKTNAPTLAGNDGFRKSLARMSKDFDALIFAQPQTVVERLIGLLTASGQQVDPKQMDDLRKIQAISAATKLEGEQMRDTLFVLKPGSEKQPALPRNSLALTSTDTLVYFAGLLGQVPSFKLPDAALDATGALHALAQFAQGFAQQGLTLADFNSTFGPEVGSAIGWAANSPQPTLLLSIDVRDPVKAQKFLHVLTENGKGESLGTGFPSFPPWVHREIDGVQFYSEPEPGSNFLAMPVIALTDKTMICGLNFESVREALRRAKTSEPKLESNALFQKIGKSVTTPTAAFGYVDTRELFERLYGTLRPFLMFGTLFMPNASNYVDLTKLPSTEAITKHLSPMVYSQSSDENGTLIESIGPVTFSQALLGLGAGAGMTIGTQMQTYLANPGAGLPVTPLVPKPSIPNSLLPLPAPGTNQTPEPSAAAP